MKRRDRSTESPVKRTKEEIKKQAEEVDEKDSASSLSETASSCTLHKEENRKIMSTVSQETVASSKGSIHVSRSSIGSEREDETNEVNGTSEENAEENKGIFNSFKRCTIQ
uniref:Uncharacterized protein n=1 Tax=Clastoptera arizonana TaxID=38151 RepID=A0A1B6EEY9_9HEMI